MAAPDICGQAGALLPVWRDRDVDHRPRRGIVFPSWFRLPVPKIPSDQLQERSVAVESEYGFPADDVSPGVLVLRHGLGDDGYRHRRGHRGGSVGKLSLVAPPCRQ